MKKLSGTSDADLLVLMAFKLKNRVLFPEKLEDAKKWLAKVRVKST
ncbi:hypothetical protein SAMN05428949_7402 [Chitinophaga sp. YR627]|nr:hypothetical protein SAMN05428949_7402 [Chitinophaga sp. YR627]